jgi:hypothetical protein
MDNLSLFLVEFEDGGYFAFWAEDADHAVEQAYNAEYYDPTDVQIDVIGVYLCTSVEFSIIEKEDK